MADRRAPGLRPVGSDDAATQDLDAAIAAEAGADDARWRALRSDVETLGAELGAQDATLDKLEVAERTLARVWLFLERGDGSLVTEAPDGMADADVAMRIVEAQEAERSRLAQEIHDGPAQALTNAIFQTEYIERVAETDPAMAAAETRTLRELLRRELGQRARLHQPAPAAACSTSWGSTGRSRSRRRRARTTGGPTITTDLTAPADELDGRPAYGGTARDAGGPAECAQARGGAMVVVEHRRGR